MRNLENLGLMPLSQLELNQTNGGDGILSDIGYAIGYTARAVYEHFTTPWGKLNPSTGYMAAKVGSY